jgi:RNA-directed DNA polymerase
VERGAAALVSWQTRGIAVDRQGDVDNVRQPGLLAKVVKRITAAAVRHLWQGILQASGRQGGPQGGGSSPWRRKLYLTEVDRRRERATEVTRHGQYTSSEEARCADDLVIFVEAQRRHEGLLHAVEPRRREAWAVLQVTRKEAKRRTVDLAHGATCSVLGCDWRRITSRRGGWRPWYTPMRQKRTALLRQLKDIFRRDESHPVERGGALINPMRRGWVRSCAVGDSSRCFGCIKAGVEKKVRRHLRRARNRKGGGWQRWRRRWLYDSLRLLNNYRGRRPPPQALPGR